jgi:hypothetical protein
MANNTTTTVTAEQIAKVDRYFDYQKNKYFCLVENERGDTDEQGDIIRYRVESHNGQLTCTCKAGQQGTPCKHRRWVLAYLDAIRAEHKALAQKDARLARLEAMGLTHEEACTAVNSQLIVNGQQADDETLVRVFGPRNRRPTEQEIEADARHYQSCAFSLMR